MSTRRKLPNDRKSVIHKFNIGGFKGYITMGMYDDGKPGELFVTLGKDGSTLGGLMDTIAILTSVALQHGVSVEYLREKFSGQRFEPMGLTTNKQIPEASSIPDYIFRWMEAYCRNAKVSDRPR